jgi:rod shape-determining protein MreC
MLKRWHYAVLIAVLLLTLVLLNLSGNTVARMKLGISSLFLPLFGLAASSQQLAGEAGDAAVSRSELLRQVESLRRENQQLKLQLSEKEKAARENERLKRILGWQQELQQKRRWKVRLASVVLREPANWWRTVQIDLGTRDGVTNSLPVLSPDGYLVGRVSAAGLTRSQVVLLGDPNCKVAARVDNPTRDTGIVGASGPLDVEFVEMGYLSRNAALQPGQDVRTSGDGGIFPKDIPIGKVVDSRLADYGLSTVARVRLGANLSGLEEVWVMFP